MDLVFHAQPHALEVDADHSVELVFVEFGGIAEQAFAAGGVVKGTVKSTVSLDCCVDQRLDFDGLGDVGGHKDRLTALALI
jgi:hypothetical protein